MKIGEIPVVKAMLNDVQVRPTFLPLPTPFLHYDAKNNAGEGHDNDTLIWKDLVGNNDATIHFGTWSWGENALNLWDTLITMPTDGLTFNEWTLCYTFTPWNMPSQSYPRLSAERTFPTLYLHYTPTLTSYRFYTLVNDLFFYPPWVPQTQANAIGATRNEVNYTTIRRTGNIVALFLNGVKVSEITIGATSSPWSNPAYLGDRPDQAGGTRPLVGKYHSFLYYNEVLTDEEIMSVYKYQKKRYPN
jgi:hypothetical protein